MTRALRITCTVAILLTPFVARADAPLPNEAKEEMRLARESVGKNDWTAAIDHARQAADLAPHNLEAQELFILFHRAGNARLLKPEEAEKRFEILLHQYQRKADAAPRDPFWQVILGDVQFYENPHASRAAFERAVKLDPNDAQALQYLGILAETRGENDLSREYFRRAADARPDDPSFLSGYVGTFMEGDFARFRDEAMKLIRKFPNSVEAVKWYYWLGARAESPEESRKYWQEAIDRYPLAEATEEQRSWLASIDSQMFESLQRDDPIEAEDFARKAIRAFEGHPEQQKIWFENHRRQAEMNLVRFAREAGRPDDVLEIIGMLEKSSGKRDPLKDDIAYEKALAQSAKGDVPAALETLLELLKKGPNPVAEAAYFDIAKKSRKSETEADDLLWKRRLQDAKPFKDFTLQDPNGKKISLSDLRGKIVLVNFWYPSCGPCRGEFPHLEKIVEQFQGKPFIVLALNTHPQEADKVKPFMEGNHYGFHALQTPTERWAEENYGVIGTPSNFLINGNGVIVDRPSVYNEATRLRLIAEISSLLAKKSESGN